MVTTAGAALPVPGPRAAPMLGELVGFLRFIRDPVAFMRRLHRDFGDVASLRQGSDRYVFVFSPRFNQQILGDVDLFHNLDAASSPLRMRPGTPLARLYGGLTNMNGPRHRQHRRLMASSLHRHHIAQYQTDVVEIAVRWIGDWRAGQVRDLFEEMRGLTLAVAVKAFLGLEPDRRGAATSRLLEAWMSAVFSPAAMLLPVDLPGLPYHRLCRLSERLEAEIRHLIERRRAAPHRHHDTLSLLLQDREAEESLTDDELVGQTNFLFMAGHATTASALTWACFLLAQHPAILGSLADDLRRALGGAPPTLDRLAGIPLLDWVVKETLRLLPPVIWWSRKSTAPFTLGPYRLGSDTQVMFSPFITQRRDDLYAEPERFEPCRWQAISPDPFSYLPFSAGPRTCLGVAFAMAEIKLVLAVLLTRFGLAIPDGTRVEYAGPMISHPKGGLPVRLTSADAAPVTATIRGPIRTIVDLA